MPSLKSADLEPVTRQYDIVSLELAPSLDILLLGKWTATLYERIINIGLTNTSNGGAGTQRVKCRSILSAERHVIHGSARRDSPFLPSAIQRNQGRGRRILHQKFARFKKVLEKIT